MGEGKLTTEARTRFRVNIRGRLILQIEEAYEVYSDPGHCGYPERNVCHRWRDARVHDLTIAARQALNGGLSRG